MEKLINERLISLDIKASSKEEVIKELIDLLESEGRLKDRKAYEQAVFEREKTLSTGVGRGVAIPHGKSSGVLKPSLAFGRKKEGVDFKSIDGKPATLFLIIAVPENSDNMYLRLLSKLITALRHDEIRDRLMSAGNKKEIIEILNQGCNK